VEFLGLAGRLLIGAVLLGSAVPKLLAPLQFQQIVLRHRLLPAAWARPLSRALPLAEIGLAGLLLAGMFIPLTAGLSGALFLSFVLAVLLAMKRGEREECGCLGRLYSPPAAWLVVQDIILAAVAFFIAYAPVSHFSVYQFVRDPAIAHARLALALALAAAGAAIAVGYLARWRAPAAGTERTISKEGSVA